MRIGIDLGGTKIEALALDDDGQPMHRERLPTPRYDYEGTLAAIHELVRRCEEATGRTGTVGVGMPGAISPATGLVKNANSVWLIGRPLLDDLQRRLGRDVRIANDANCFAVSEAADGAAAGADVVFGVIVGTGTGGGIAVHGRVLTGPNAIAGEWGHNPMPWPEDDERPGPACYCGRHGCIETFLSGPGLADDHARRTGAALEPREIVDWAAGGDAAAEETLTRYERRMARALASVINLLDPDVIVLGGGLSGIERLYDTVPRLWSKWVFAAGRGESVRTCLRRASHGASSGVRGAAWLWPDE